MVDMLLHLVVTLSVVTALEGRSTFSIDPNNVLDMSYHFKENETHYWPTNPGFVLKKLSDSSYPLYVLFHSFSAGEHGGTHIDAPNHFAKGKLPVDRIPVDHFIGEGIRVDIREQVDKDINYTMQVSDLEDWEKENGKIPDKTIMLVYTGYGKNYHKSFYIQNDEGIKSFPGVSGEAARWLVKNRKIYGIGIDTASIDYGASVDVPAHLAFSEANMFILENVANMDKLWGPKGFTIAALPMKIAGGSGGPTRILAFKSGCSGVLASLSLIAITIICKFFF